MSYLKIVAGMGLCVLAFSACVSGPENVVQSGEVEEVVVQEADVRAVDLEKSELKWHGEKVVGSGHGGSVKLASGELNLEGEKVVGGNFVIDMTSLVSDENNAKLEEHLKGADFFDVEQYPEAKFEITAVDEAMMVSGNLEIKGITRNISFPAVKEGEDFTAKFAIDRTEWDIQYGSGKFFDDLGDNVIEDEMEFEVKLVLS